MNFINGFMSVINSKAIGEITALLLLMAVACILVFLAVKYAVEKMGLK